MVVLTQVQVMSLAVILGIVGLLLHEFSHYAVARQYTSDIEIEILSMEPYIHPDPSDFTDLGWRICCAMPFLIGIFLISIYLPLMWPLTTVELLIVTPFFGSMFVLSPSDLYGILYPSKSRAYLNLHPEPPTMLDGIRLLRAELRHE